MVRHVCEGQGLCPIQVASPSWLERGSRESGKLYSQINVIDKDFLQDCSSKQVTPDHLGF
jgi:hypothetical protein